MYKAERINYLFIELNKIMTFEKLNEK